MYSIYIEVSKKVLEAFTKELGMIESFYKSKKLGDLLVPFTEQLQNKLKQENIFLPTVLYSYDPSLPDTSIRTTYGIHNDIYNGKSLEGILRFIAGRYSLQDDPAELAQNGHGPFR